MKKISSLLFLFLILNSCVVNTPTYYVSGTNEKFPTDINSKKWSVYFSNFSSDAERDVKNQITDDFQKLLPSNVKFESQLMSIESPPEFLSAIDSEILESIKEETNAEILAVFKIQMKYQTQDKAFSIQKVPYEKYRNMFVFLDVYDLETKQLLYTKYGVSQMKIDENDDYIAHTGIKSQAIKTYEKLKNDFLKNIHS